MAVANEKLTGTNYTATVALLVVAFIFIPAAVIASRPIGHLTLAAAIICSTSCIGLARTYWMKSSQLSIPSIADSGTSKR